MQCLFESTKANVIAAAFGEDGRKFKRDDAVEKRDVFFNQLFLQTDRMRGNDNPPLATVFGFLIFLKREDRWNEIAKTFPDAGAGFDDQVLFLVDCSRNGVRHFELLFSLLVILKSFGD